jgi:uncharacterized RDD family membrane protein YckC
MIWTKFTLKSLHDEVFGEPVDHPIIIRGLAYIIDFLIFTFWTILVYQIIGAERFISRGIVLLLDILILTIYFTFSSSYIFDGQSIGKRVFRIRVVDADANYLGLGKSFIRSVPIALATNVHGVSYFLATEHENLVFIGHAVLIIMIFGVLYFSILKLNRQGLHDIVVGSQVIPTKRLVTTKSSITLALIISYVFLTSCYLIYIRLTIMR